MSEMCSDGVDVGLLQSDMCCDGVEVGVSTSPKWWMPVETDKGPGTATSLQAAGTSRELSTEMPVGTDDGPETANGLLTAGTSRNWSTAWNTQFKTRLPQMVFFMYQTTTYKHQFIVSNPHKCSRWYILEQNPKKFTWTTINGDGLLKTNKNFNNILQLNTHSTKTSSNLPAPMHQQKQLALERHYRYPAHHIMFTSGLSIRNHFMRLRNNQVLNKRVWIQNRIQV